MNLLLLGRGKIGSQVAEIATERKHHLQVLTSKENVDAAALTPEKLGGVHVVIDFTAPHCVLAHIDACAKAGKSMVIGTTGWYKELSEVRKIVEKHGVGFVYAANFSIGVNIFYEITRAAAAALHYGYTAQIFERHHAHKKDAPSGTALAIQQILRESGNTQEPVEIISFREGEVVGLHEAVLESNADRIYLCHDAKSRRAFAEGAVLAAEWLSGKQGFYDFKDIWREL
jgi:4-hydroxy-tetrahydrodipicolinate reductase